MQQTCGNISAYAVFDSIVVNRLVYDFFVAVVFGSIERRETEQRKKNTYTLHFFSRFPEYIQTLFLFCLIWSHFVGFVFLSGPFFFFIFSFSVECLTYSVNKSPDQTFIIEIIFLVGIFAESVTTWFLFSQEKIPVVFFILMDHWTKWANIEIGATQMIFLQMIILCDFRLTSLQCSFRHNAYRHDDANRKLNEQNQTKNHQKSHVSSLPMRVSFIGQTIKSFAHKKVSKCEKPSEYFITYTLLHGW